MTILPYVAFYSAIFGAEDQLNHHNEKILLLLYYADPVGTFVFRVSFIHVSDRFVVINSFGMEERR